MSPGVFLPCVLAEAGWRQQAIDYSLAEEQLFDCIYFKPDKICTVKCTLSWKQMPTGTADSFV